MTDAEQNALIEITRAGAELVRLLKRLLEVYGELPDRLEDVEAAVAKLVAKAMIAGNDVKPLKSVRDAIDDHENRIAVLEMLAAKLDAERR